MAHIGLQQPQGEKKNETWDETEFMAVLAVIKKQRV